MSRVRRNFWNRCDQLVLSKSQEYSPLPVKFGGEEQRHDDPNLKLWDGLHLEKTRVLNLTNSTIQDWSFLPQSHLAFYDRIAWAIVIISCFIVTLFVMTSAYCCFRELRLSKAKYRMIAATNKIVNSSTELVRQSQTDEEAPRLPEDTRKGVLKKTSIQKLPVVKLNDKALTPSNYINMPPQFSRHYTINDFSQKEVDKGMRKSLSSDYYELIMLQPFQWPSYMSASEDGIKDYLSDSGMMKKDERLNGDHVKMKDEN